jgi:hypothetical protein
MRALAPAGSGNKRRTWPDLGLNHVERVTGIEPALSARESVPSGPVRWPDLRRDMSASDRERPLVAGLMALMARRARPRIIVAEKAWSAVAWYAVVRMRML